MCRICGVEKLGSEYYYGRNICKVCVNKDDSFNKPVRDVKGNVIVNAESRNLFSLEKAEEIARDLYDNEKEVVIDSRDLAEDVECIVTYFTRNFERCVSQYSVAVTDENNKKIIAALSKAEAAIQKMKASFTYE